MSTYTIYLGTNPVATVKGTEYAYEVYAKTRELAELLNREASVVWDETGEEVAYFEPDCDWLEE
jgi:Mn-dependent DtxR family transcriptional regulator